MACRVPYTAADDRQMWSYLVEKTREDSPSAKTPMGIALWKEFLTDNPSFEHTFSSTQTHYRRHLHDKMYKAELPFEDLLFLLQRHKRKLTKQQHLYVEKKFKRQIKLNKRGIPVEDISEDGGEKSQNGTDPHGVSDSGDDGQRKPEPVRPRTPRRAPERKRDPSPGGSSLRSTSPLIFKRRRIGRLASPDADEPSQSPRSAKKIRPQKEESCSSAHFQRRLSSVSTQTPTKLVAMMEASESCKTPSRSNAFILPSYSVLHDQIIQELATDNSLSAVQRMAKKRALDALMEELRT
ncbi:hypothetical protein QR680_009812 [Steinernema hermaphroditum]|uniref:TERF2-interacting telomeric protein 1 Myb domain-containing protein n=1 Tax=Steinernema hermaphroditum TaxID=289476 RepID=A0AA39MAM2_9BILA|nr:hypothetical protein QR680_009812 [Steinernema hermaphroditum]